MKATSGDDALTPAGLSALADAAISFDFDGVLVRSPFGHGVLFPVLKELARAWAGRTGAAPDEAERRIRDLAWAEFRARAARGDPVQAYNWQAIVEAVALSVGERFDGSLAAMTLDYGRRIEGAGDRALLYPGVHEALGALKARGACLLLLTNGFRDYQLPMARALGLDGYFQAILASDDLGTVKPRPEAFERAFSACPAGRSARRFHVGDTLSHDVAGARACGIFAVWIEWELPEELGRLGPLERAGAAGAAAAAAGPARTRTGARGPAGSRAAGVGVGAARCRDPLAHRDGGRRGGAPRLRRAEAVMRASSRSSSAAGGSPCGRASSSSSLPAILSAIVARPPCSHWAKYVRSSSDGNQSSSRKWATVCSWARKLPPGPTSPTTSTASVSGSTVKPLIMRST